MKTLLAKIWSNVHVRVLTIYCILTGVLTYPLVNNLGNAIPGTIWDNWMYYWSIWWVKKAVLELGVNPLHTNYLFYPTGATLYFHTTNLPGAILSIPVQAAFGTIVGYNANVLFSFVFGGYVTYLLGRYLFGNTLAAFLMGLAFTFSAIHLAHGQQLMDLASVQWLSLSVLFLIKMVKDKRPSSSLFAAVSLFIASITAWYFALSLFVFAFLLVLWCLVKDRGPGKRHLLIQAALMLGIYTILISPILVPMGAEISQSSFMESSERTLALNSADLLDFFVAHGRLAIWEDRLTRLNDYLSIGVHVGESYNIYFGYPVMLLAVLGVWKDSRRALFWLLCFLSFLMLSLGPNLHVGGREKFDGLALPLPYRIFYDLNVGKVARAPIRQAIMTTLMLDVLAGFGLAWILSRIEEEKRHNLVSKILRSPKLWAASVGILICLDSLSIPFPLTALPSRVGCNASAPVECLPLPGYGKLSLMSGGTVLDIPAIEIRQTPDLSIPVIYMAAQTLHQKKIIGGRLARDPLYSFWGNIPPEFRRVWLGVNDDVLQQPQASVASMFDYLDVRYFVLHRSFFEYAGITEDKVTEKLHALFGNRVVLMSDVGQTAIYSIEDSPPSMFPFALLWSNWYDRERIDGKTIRWMTNDATLKVINSQAGPTKLSLSFEVLSLIQSRKLEIRLDDQVVDALTVSSDGWKPWQIQLVLSPGEHTIVFHSLQPPQKLTDTDMRLLSVAFASVNAVFQ